MKLYHITFTNGYTYTNIASNVRELCSMACGWMEHYSLETTDIVEISEHEFDMISTTVH